MLVILFWAPSIRMMKDFQSNPGDFDALCVLSYSVCIGLNKSLVSDEILCDGDFLYRRLITGLKADGKFIHSLLSFE